MTIADVYRSLWRRKLTVVALTVIFGATAWYLDGRRPDEYRATAVVRIQQKITDPTAALTALQTASILARTYADIATTLGTAQRVQHVLDGRVPLDQIAGNLEAKQVGNVDLLSISATSRDPRTAAAIARATPKALQQFVDQTGTTGERITVVELPTVPTHPFSPRPWVAAAVAAVVGLLFNGGLVLALELLGDRAVLEDVDRVGGAPVVGVIPNLSLRPLAQLPSAEAEGTLGALRARGPAGA
jgi:capsular polysaccharide biosynthesis protein